MGQRRFLGVRLPIMSAGLLLFALTWAAVAAVPAGARLDAAGADAWVWQSPQPQGNPLADLDFVDSTHGWAVGQKGAIVVTSDMGDNWRVQASGTDSDLHAVEFVDASTGWAVGQGGTILVTHDGGTHWASQVSGTSVDLRSVSFVDPQHGWAVGYTVTRSASSGELEYAGTSLATVDGGTTWTAQSLRGQTTLRSVDFVDQLHGWVTEGWGVLRTTDGGHTWAETQMTLMSLVAAVTFTDAMNGFAVGSRITGGYPYSNVIAKTSDGGLTWRQVYADQVKSGYPMLSDVSFAAGGRGWAVGDSSAVLTTTDGGETWQDQGRPAGIRYRRWGDAVAVCAIDGQHAVGLETSLSHLGVGVLQTSDGGATWKCRAAESFARVTAVAFVDRRRGWAAEYNDLTGTVDILATRDGGGTWTTSLHRDYPRPFQALSAVDAKHCWAAHYSPGIGILWRTADGGASWSYVAKSGNWDRLVGDVKFVNASRGWAVSGGQIRTSVNGGRTWTDQTAPTTKVMLGITFVDARRGWIVGEGGLVMSTANGGTTWRLQSTGVTQDLVRVSFVSASQGWAVGTDGAIVTTSDGGATWRTQQSGTTQDLTGVDFADSRHGWAVGAAATLLRTTDGGQTWITQQNPAVADFYAVDFADPDHGWVTGDGGAILAMGR